MSLGEEIGVSRTAIYWWLEGRCRPKVASAMKLAALGGPSVDVWGEVE